MGEKALLRFLSDRPNIKTVYLCLDSDEAGNDACSRLAELVPEGLTVHRLVPLYKDWNEVLQHRAEITDGKYIREAIYGLKEPPQEETVEIIRMSEVDTQTVEWLWKPYIPFGKVTIVQGNPGEGKTTFALRLAAACTTGGTLPGMKPLPPFQVIYQTAEDGLGDTVKPRLIEAEADLDRVLVIDEAKRELTLSDERIEKAITQNGARLIILDPIQAYMGEKDRHEPGKRSAPHVPPPCRCCRAYRVCRYPYRTSQQSCRRAERIPGLRFYRLPRRSKERPADRAREARAECARYRA